MATQLQLATVAVRDAPGQREDVKTVAKFYVFALDVQMKRPGRCGGPRGRARRRAPGAAARRAAPGQRAVRCLWVVAAAAVAERMLCGARERACWRRAATALTCAVRRAGCSRCRSTAGRRPSRGPRPPRPRELAPARAARRGRPRPLLWRPPRPRPARRPARRTALRQRRLRPPSAAMRTARRRRSGGAPQPTRLRQVRCFAVRARSAHALASACHYAARSCARRRASACRALRSC